MSECKPCRPEQIEFVNLPDEYDLGGLTVGDLRYPVGGGFQYRLVSIENRDGTEVWKSDE